MNTIAKIKNVGFISTRFQGTDGVSLETEKWVEVLERNNYSCFFFAGLSNWDKEKTMVTPEAFFDHPAIVDVQVDCFGQFTRSSDTTGEIHAIRRHLKKQLYVFVEKYNIDMLIVENALSIPMNIPLGLAITEFIAETGIPSIGHHHDFYWERDRFIVNSVSEYIKMAFPPTIHSMRHVVINTQAQKDISYRRGLSSMVIPNIFDYKKQCPSIDDYNKDAKKDLGLADDDIMFLQPTRVIARKGIEHSIELVNRLDNPKIKLVITHQTKDEGKEYEKRIRSYAKLLNVELIIKPEIIGSERGINKNGDKIYTLWDIYPHADFITYPSTYEGFGNAFLETIYFRKPMLVNRYSIYQRDIEPLEFDVVGMDTYIDDEVVEEVNFLLEDNDRVKEMTDRNYETAMRFFSYEVLETKLKSLIVEFEGIISGE